MSPARDSTALKDVSNDVEMAAAGPLRINRGRPNQNNRSGMEGQ